MTNAVDLAQTGTISSSWRNRIINGGMTIDQRNAGASVSATSGGQYFLDRWCASISASGKFAVQQNAGSVTKPIGFANYLGVTSSTAWAVGASDYATLNQFIEGFNVADLQWGTSNAASVTLSFVVYSSLTGTFGGLIHNGINAGGQTRTYPFTFTVSAANTWTTISLTINGDTTGTWGSSNGAGIAVCFSLAAGSSKVATSGAWTGVAAYSGATGQTNILATNAATFYITGVQLEKGSAASPFDYRDYGRELIMCQRYFESTYESGTSPGVTSQTANSIMVYAQASSLTVSQNSSWYYRVTKRTSPTVTLYNPSTGATGTFRNIAQNTDIATTQQSVSSNFVSYASQAAGIAANEKYCAHYTASSEL